MGWFDSWGWIVMTIMAVGACGFTLTTLHNAIRGR